MRLFIKRYFIEKHSSSHCWQMERVPFAAFSATNGPPYGTDVLLLVDREESRSVQIAIVGSHSRKVRCTP